MLKGCIISRYYRNWKILAGYMLKMKSLFIKIGDWPGPIKLLSLGR